MSKINAEEKQVYIKTLIIVTSALIITLLWFMWAMVINSKQNIFESMLANSLSTRGVTKKVIQDNRGVELEQLSQVQFGALNAVEVKTTVKQGEDDSQTTIVTKTIATPRQNYARYEKISTPKNQDIPNLDGVTNIWGVQSSKEGGSSVFSESVYGVVLFGNLPPQLRNEILDLMDEKQVYVPNYDGVEGQTVNGKSAYMYPVSINTKSYVELLKRYDELLGLNLFENLNPNDYENTPSINVKLYVDKQSHQLLKIEYEDGRAEELEGYGIGKEIEIPEDFISRNELEAKLQKILK